MKSETFNNSSNSTFSTPISVALSSVRYGSYTLICIFSPLALSATIDPIFPHPIIPSIFEYNSIPVYFDFSHLPWWVELFALGIFLAKDIIKAIVCSAVVIEFPNGVFITIVPFAVAASISTLSTPIPALPITFKFEAYLRISFVTFVLDLIANPSKSLIVSDNCSGDNSVLIVTSILFFLNISSALLLNLSEIKTLAI